VMAETEPGLQLDRTERQTILVVDDMPTNLELIFDCLEAEGFRVVIAIDGEEALQRARLVQPDLILLDVMMPDMDGFEVCSRLKGDTQTSDIPVLFMTSLTDTHEKVRGFKAGGVDYICKPFQVDEVIIRINTHLSLRQVRQELALHNSQLRAETTLRAGQTRILEMIATNMPVSQVLSGLIELIETLSDGSIVSVCLLDDEAGYVESCLAPSLPDTYEQAMAGLKIGPKAGSCGSAMYLCRPVIVPDLKVDPLWDGYRQLVAPYKLSACWSMPLISADGNVLGSLAMYHPDVRSPSAEDRRLIETAAHLALIALEREQNLRRIDHMARHDALTDLPNRTLLKERLHQAIANARRHRSTVAVLFLDLDGFKQVNDSLGHAMGDLLLQAVANKLRHCVREVDVVARWGGDEFVILLQEIVDRSSLIRIVENILANVGSVFQVERHRIRVGCSIGISQYPADGVDPDSLLRTADLAMYEAKSCGRGSFRFFCPQLKDVSGSRAQASLAGEV